MKAILGEYFGLPVEIEEYVGQWLELPERSRVGVSANQLGVDFCLGSQVWDRQHSFRICFGPLTLEQYNAMLPDGESFAALVAWVAYVYLRVAGVTTVENVDSRPRQLGDPRITISSLPVGSALGRFNPLTVYHQV